MPNLFDLPPELREATIRRIFELSKSTTPIPQLSTAVPTLFSLPNELLDEIVDCVPPKDFENLALSCKHLYQFAGYERRHRHFTFTRWLKSIENGWGALTRHYFPELLGEFLDMPNVADYVDEVAVKPWNMCWYATPLSGDDGKDDGLWKKKNYWAKSKEHDMHPPYTDSLMKAFEGAVNSARFIPTEEKGHWISKIKAGDENPVIALLFSRLDYMTSLLIVLKNQQDHFILKTLQRIAKNPLWSSLSRLCNLKIFGNLLPSHRFRSIAACAALPSIVSLEARELVEEPLDSAEPSLELKPHLSSVRNLKIRDCRFSAQTIFSLIRSAKSLQSFTYTYYREGSSISCAWVRAALLRYASRSLEELTLHDSRFLPDWDGTGCSFRSYCNLRVLTIDYGLLMGNKYYETNKIVSLLPSSLEVLNLHKCRFYLLEWFRDFVNWVIRVKSRLLPCLKELNFKEVWSWFSSEEVLEIAAGAPFCINFGI
ncbi:hypothetical protein IMSHALPRED_001027 [Imshaugia aleurites]|uniref:F-box domain-containing protein n=1 Tax=Imshaugia aleurites TaxID=172621 RepID=A0A8H3J0W2_9LECA|nr:hypothetical protein IMSHALPRED_001027 [Imshaugia aleurites]